MSTLTKVLIVLLTISSIFLCGIVVTYVANATDYKQKYDGLYQSYNAAKKSEDNAKTELNKTIEEKNREADKLKEQIASQEEEIIGLKANLANAQRDRDDAQRSVDNWASITKDFQQTNDKQGLRLDDALAQIVQLETEQTKERKELKETTTALIEKMAIIAQLEDKSKRLLEEKTELQNKLDQFLQQYGKATAAPEPVTAIKEKAKVTPPTKDIDLEGLVTVVDLKNLLAEISIGEADGVKDGMRFHATRGDKFICDIVVFDVQPEKAIGLLELMQDQPQDQPKVGDNVSTNL